MTGHARRRALRRLSGLGGYAAAAAVFAPVAAGLLLLGVHVLAVAVILAAMASAVCVVVLICDRGSRGGAR